MTTKQLNKRTKDFPPEGTATLLNYGFNFYYHNRTYSFYYGAKNPNLGKMVVNSRVFHFKVGKELETFNLAQEKKEVITEALPEPILPINKAQQCIDHLEKKKELVLASKRSDNARLLNMLTILTQELKQYL